MKQGTDNLTIFYITQRGHELARKIQELFEDADVLHFSADELASRWHGSKGIICIMAAGIVVRTLAPLLQDKKSDPAVVVIDENGAFVISLLSGHLGGANELARKIAAQIGGQPVITTASDVQGRTALDLWARQRGLYVEDYEKLKRLSMKMLRGARLRLFSECTVATLPGEFELADSPEGVDIIVSERIMERDATFLRPPALFAGIGCNRGTLSGEIIELIGSVLEEHNLSLHSLRELATIDIKKDEAGISECARHLKLKVKYCSGDLLNSISTEMNMESSAAVREATGAVAVAEPAAVAAARGYSDNCELLIPKIRRGNVTLAIAKAEYTL